ncbi:transposase [Amycolatopsis acidicola]|uniref:Transposase n=1 Tax=Amycolatopsis acidicola TaxID=2596893 RepID=A0A5N0VDE6_9PSEU|nr:transposase [Amycolatopsis acidicola]KAA9164369.1 transposase [Amycolatopsis acidicola]
MAKRFVQATTKIAFTLQDDGTVLAEDPGSGTSGVFTRTGDWISGELTHADQVMCEFVGGTYVAPDEPVRSEQGSDR